MPERWETLPPKSPLVLGGTGLCPQWRSVGSSPYLGQASGAGCRVGRNSQDLLPLGGSVGLNFNPPSLRVPLRGGHKGLSLNATPAGKRGFLPGRACLALLQAGLRFIIHSGHMDEAPACMGEAACVGGAGQVHTDGRAGGRVAAGPKGQERAGPGL